MESAPAVKPPVYPATVAEMKQFSAVWAGRYCRLISFEEQRRCAGMDRILEWAFAEARRFLRREVRKEDSSGGFQACADRTIFNAQAPQCERCCGSDRWEENVQVWKLKPPFSENILRLAKLTETFLGLWNGVHSFYFVDRGDTLKVTNAYDRHPDILDDQEIYLKLVFRAALVSEGQIVVVPESKRCPSYRYPLYSNLKNALRGFVNYISEVWELPVLSVTGAAFKGSGFGEPLVLLSGTDNWLATLLHPPTTLIDNLLGCVPEEQERCLPEDLREKNQTRRRLQTAGAAAKNLLKL